MKCEIIGSYFTYHNILQPDWVRHFFSAHYKKRKMTWLLTNSWTGLGVRRQKLKSIRDLADRRMKQIVRKTVGLKKGEATDLNFAVKEIRDGSDPPKNQEILKYLGAVGLPTIEFWSDEGEHCEKQRVSGFLEAKEFSEHVDQNVNQK